MSNTFGRLFRLTTFGESHGPAVGGVIDGCPAGIELGEAMLQKELDQRRPAPANPASTTRAEPDRVRLLSGVFEGRTTGAPIGFLIENKAQNPDDYALLKEVFRPGHADYTMYSKYGRRDWRGGGRASARETASRVAGGAVAQALLRRQGIAIRACTLSIGEIASSNPPLTVPEEAESRPFHAVEAELAGRWEEALLMARAGGDSLGGIVMLEVTGIPAGLGEPVFDKLDARIGYAMLGVGAVKGVEIGAGFGAAVLRGSANNDPMHPGTAQKTDEAAQGSRTGPERQSVPAPLFLSNNAGGVLGGISTGQSLIVKVGIKPISSIGLEQETINTGNESVTLALSGRHDACAIPRVIPVLRAMLALTLADFLLLQRAGAAD